MMKNKTTKIILNSVLLAAMAALGITVYQVGTSPRKDTAQNELAMEDSSESDFSDGEEPLVDAGTNQVEASLGNEEGFDPADDEMAFGNRTSDDTDTWNEDTEDTSSAAMTDGTIMEENIEDGAADLETGSSMVAAQTSAYGAPEINFSEDTLMEWPVNGNILLDYSMDQSIYFPTLDQYKLSPAIAVKAVEDAPVMAAANGSVYEVKEDVRTGTTVTMELGNGYQAIYGQLKDLTVQTGDTVKEGQIIGYISGPTKYYSREGSNLYFAMKKDGKPIDPIAYLP